MSQSPSLLDQITTRLIAQAEHTSRLRTQRAEAEDDLDLLRVAEQVVKHILTEHIQEAPGLSVPATQEPELLLAFEAAPAKRTAQLLPGGRLIPNRHKVADTDGAAGAAPPADYQALVAAVCAADAAMSCKTICRPLRLSVEPGQVEGLRTKLNRPAARAGHARVPAARSYHPRDHLSCPPRAPEPCPEPRHP
ncbi:hypothetical protein [Nonomuraea sp. NPDC050643]|uniref:hypothetical protein n=1 Tax=Nonomuraea sp. NPDC050643 TaxID=3155660 RepID=UPI0033EAEA72